MENVTPTLVLLWDVKRALEKGQSVSVGLRKFTERNLKHEFSSFVNGWQLHLQSQQKPPLTQHLSPTRRHLLALLEHGLAGQSILEALKSYELELILSCDDEIQSHIAKLPLILLIPLMGLIFPSLMMLLIWPALKMFQF